MHPLLASGTPTPAPTPAPASAPSLAPVLPAEAGPDLKVQSSSEAGPLSQGEELQLRSVVIHNTVSHATLRLLGSHDLTLDLTFDQDCIEPLFSGGAWAGTTVWNASMLLADWLEQRVGAASLSRKRAIELGAGTAMPGVAAWLLGADVLLTEQAPLHTTIAHNLRLNFPDSARPLPEVLVLDWFLPLNEQLGSAGGCGFDYVLVSDCVYEPLYGKAWVAMVRVVKELCSLALLGGVQTMVLCALQRRNGDGVELFLAHLRDLGFAYTRAFQVTNAENENLELYEIQKT